MLSQIDTLNCQQKELGTKEDKRKLMMCVCTEPVGEKTCLITKQRWNSEETNHIALSIVELCLADGYGWSHQLVSQHKNLLNRQFLSFHGKLLERFRVALKTFMGLAMPSQYYQTVVKGKLGEAVMG